MESPSGTADKLSPILTGIAGEYFVAAELSRRGFIAAITLRNTRGVDILVSRPGGTQTASVQVKTQLTGRVSWRLHKSDETPKGKDHYYVFVALNGCDGIPEYHVVEGNHVAESCRKTHREWLRGTKRDGGARKDTSMRVFRPGEEDLNAWDRICVD